MAAARFPSSLQQLWHGELPLPLAFWRYLITYGFTLNLAATILVLAVFLAEGPVVLAAFIHLLPFPYIALAAVGTWRSANRFDGNPNLSNGSKLFAVFWMILMLVF
jgi:hypothetical protein